MVGTSIKELEDCCTWLYLLRGSCRTALRYSCHCFLSSVLCTSATPCLRPATAFCNSCSQGTAHLALYASHPATRHPSKSHCPEVFRDTLLHAEADRGHVFACDVHFLDWGEQQSMYPGLASNFSRYFDDVSRTVASCSKSGKGLCAGSSSGTVTPDRLTSLTACKLL